jgi:hypothetical protein
LRSNSLRVGARAARTKENPCNPCLKSVPSV